MPGAPDNRHIGNLPLSAHELEEASSLLMPLEVGSTREDLRLLGNNVQTFYPWASLTTRLWKGSEHLEEEWTVGPIPFTDGLGREISVRPSAFLRLSYCQSLANCPLA